MSYKIPSKSNEPCAFFVCRSGRFEIMKLPSKSRIIAHIEAAQLMFFQRPCLVSDLEHSLGHLQYFQQAQIWPKSNIRSYKKSSRMNLHIMSLAVPFVRVLLHNLPMYCLVWNQEFDGFSLLMGERVSQEHYHEIDEFNSTRNSWGIYKEFWCHLGKFWGDKLKTKQIGASVVIRFRSTYL